MSHGTADAGELDGPEDRDASLSSPTGEDLYPVSTLWAMYELENGSKDRTAGPGRFKEAIRKGISIGGGASDLCETKEPSRIALWALEKEFETGCLFTSGIRGSRRGGRVDGNLLQCRSNDQLVRRGPSVLSTIGGIIGPRGFKNAV